MGRQIGSQARLTGQYNRFLVQRIGIGGGQLELAHHHVQHNALPLLGVLQMDIWV